MKIKREREQLKRNQVSKLLKTIILQGYLVSLQSDDKRMGICALTQNQVIVQIILKNEWASFQKLFIKWRD
jgi:hypothetical protein